MFNFILKILIVSIFLINTVYAKKITSFNISGNDRIPDQTIIMFTEKSINDVIDENSLNSILKNLYNTNFFKDVSVKFENNILFISVNENPIIQNISYNGIKSQKIRKIFEDNATLRSRDSFDKIILKQDELRILSSLKDLGYFFSTFEVYVENLDNNQVNISYEIDLGKRSKIKKISFLGNKIFKERKLRSIIVSEEYKFWKFISGKKYLNENLTKLDTRLLKNFYLNKGYYNAEVQPSYAKLINKNEFELVFNIDAKNIFLFGDLSIKLPSDFEDTNYQSIVKLFSKIKGEKYSINMVNQILEELENITISQQYESTSASVIENIDDNIINLTFELSETERFIIEKINIFGNNVTKETVIRNQFEIDEGDPFNEILQKKTENNIKSLNFFKSVNIDTIDGSVLNSKVLNINLEEKPTGEISAGAGVGTSGGTISFGVRENNYLGSGVQVNSNITLNDDSIKGLLSVTNPNVNNTDKSFYYRIEAIDLDRLSNFGYKSSKLGFSFGTDFEYFKDFNLGTGVATYYEDIETDNSASTRQQAQDGNYFDTFLKLDFDLDKRNQKFKTSDGYRGIYSVDLPLISENNTITNSYNYRFFQELFEENISTASFLIKSANSITGDNIKLSERLYIPSRRLRGFESGKVGPKDGNDFIGGNFVTALNLSSTLPNFIENSENLDFLFFFYSANIWGVDYDSSINDNYKIRSSIGLGIDWFTPIGPLNFSLSQPLTKSSSDTTETFRFNLGTSF